MVYRFQPDPIVELLRTTALLALALLTGTCTTPSAPPNHAPSSTRSASADDSEKSSVAADAVRSRIAPKPASSFDDSITADPPVAVFFRPDSLQLEKIKAVNSRTMFINLTHDSYYMMRNAKQVIQKYWPRIKILETSTHRWLVFRKSSDSIRSIDLNKINDMSGIILFDGTKDPILVDMPNIDTQLWFYFGKDLK
jgi:hypothetical protein